MNHAKNKELVYIILIIFFAGCKGEDGAVGPSGLNSLIATAEEPAGTNCEFGGLQVETGLDNNSNGVLEASEVLKTDYVCSVSGNSSLINVANEPSGAVCENAGIKIESGVDANRNEVLDDEEIQVTRYVCNGVDGEGVLDKLIILKLFSNFGNRSVDPVIFPARLPNFDVRRYSNIDSISFVVSDIQTFVNFNDVIGEAIFELYDMTNNEVIPNSTIVSDDILEVASGNLLNSFPQSEVLLGVRVASESNDFTSQASNAYLVLVRN